MDLLTAELISHVNQEVIGLPTKELIDFPINGLKGLLRETLIVLLIKELIEELIETELRWRILI